MISVVELRGIMAREPFARVEKWLVSALENGGFTLYTIHDIWQAVTSAEHPTATLLMIYDDSVLKGAAVTRKSEYSLGDVYEIIALGGEDMASWFPDFHARLLAMAKRDGCKILLESGRDGWVRFLEKYGWREAPRIMIRSVD